MKQLGHGAGYRYAHDEPDAYAAGEKYFPDGMQPARYYDPVERGLRARIDLVHAWCLLVGCSAGAYYLNHYVGAT
jgi:replication-associated recombination protein RarA